MTKKLTVINLYGGPGSGKSTTAAGLFNLMKHHGLRVELVTEVAKDKTYAGDRKALGNQLLLLGLQEHRQRVLEGEVDWCITDSPLPLGLVYASPEQADLLDPLVYEAMERYDNRHFFIERCKPYATYGRNQTASEALAIDINVRAVYEAAIMGTYGCDIPGDEDAEYAIAGALGLNLYGDPL